MSQKIVNVAPLMDGIRNQLLQNGDDPVLKDMLERLRMLPDYKYIAHWQWNKEGYWECSECLNASDALAKEGKDCNPYMFRNTKFCGCCGAEMVR